MRYTVEFVVDGNEIYKDKNKIIYSWIKHSMEKYDKKMYDTLFNSGAVEKDYTFSLYLGSGAVFERETIKLPSNNIKMFFSCHNPEDVINFYNIFNKAMHKPFSYKDITITPKSLSLGKKVVFPNNVEFFKTLSPIIVREHNKETNKSTYHDLSTDEGLRIFRRNIIDRLRKKFPEKKLDYENTFSVNIVKNKMVTIRHHNLNIPANLAVIKIESKPYILEYLYNSGKLSSLNASGNGLVEIVNTI